MAARFPDDVSESERTKFRNEEDFSGKLQKVNLISGSIRVCQVFGA